MSIVESLVEYFKTCPSIVNPISVLRINDKPINHSIDPFGNEATISENICGVKTKEFRFYLTTTRRSETLNQEFSTAEFNEAIIDWVETQNDNLNFPTASGKEIRVENQPSLFTKAEGMSQGIYQILMTYVYLD